MSAKDAKIAAAPISWGVCEVPGWGHQMSPERVLKEMSELGFTATEFGPLGFLPIDPAIKAAILKEHGMTATGGFYPAILHRADHDPIPAVKVELESYIASGANVLVLAANSGIDGYDAALPVLTDAEWEILFKNLDAIKAVAAEVGVQTVLHPHVGTMVETYDHVMRVVNGSQIQFCLDTGHMMIGGTNPSEFADKYPDRVAHAHLKDVNESVAQKVRSNEVTYYDGMLSGLYTPLGKGDANIREIVRSLVKYGYTGWFVLEQDLAIFEEPAPGAGPFASAKESVEFLRTVLKELEAEGF
jgi:inosose dehydratase